jgi:secreted trypsin-like serine protease
MRSFNFFFDMKSFYKGDTGGPLMLYSNQQQRYELVGITSYRDACMTEGLFTRIAPFIELILSILKRPPPTLPPSPTFPTFPPPIPTTTSPDALGKL